MARTASALVAGMTVALLAGGCGGASDAQLAQARRQGAAQASAAAASASVQAQQEQLARQQARLRRQFAQLKAAQRKKATPSPTPTSSGSSGSSSSGGSAVGSTSCGNNVSVNSVTTCQFAQVVQGDWISAGGGSASFYSYSPVTHRNYWMTCTAGVVTVCRGGNEATVYIR